MSFSEPICRLEQVQWDQMLLGVPGLSSRDQRIFEWVLHVLSTALPWHDLPEDMGISARTVWNRHQHWQKQHLWDEIFSAFFSTLPMEEQSHWQGRLRRAALLRQQKCGPAKRPRLLGENA